MSKINTEIKKTGLAKYFDKNRTLKTWQIVAIVAVAFVAGFILGL